MGKTFRTKAKGHEMTPPAGQRWTRYDDGFKDEQVQLVETFPDEPFPDEPFQDELNSPPLTPNEATE